MTEPFRIGVDIGGTFTDIVFMSAGGQVFTRKVPSTVDDYGRGIVNDYYEAFQMFKELGIFGIVVGESKIYYTGEFEYTQPGSLAISEDDTFCIHPAFAAEYRVGRDNNGWTSKKEVYPHGTDLELDLAA